MHVDPRRYIFLLVMLALLSAPAAHALFCSGGGPRPEWVERPEAATDQYLFAAGVSDSARAPLAERIASAKQNALKNLSEMIQVSVRNALVLEQTSRKTRTGEFTDSSLSSVTKTSTEASLRNVEIVDTWEDPQSCDLWLRARVSRADVERGRREGVSKMLFAVLQENLALAQKEEAPTDRRADAVEAAQDVLPRISLELVPQAASAAYYRQLLDRLGSELRKARDSREQARGELRAADLLVSEAGAQGSEAERSKRLIRAAAFYKSLLARHVGGIPELFAPGDILFRLGEIEELRGSACGARNYFQQAQESTQLEDRRETARRKAESLVCSPADLEKTLWRQYFEGRSLTLVCHYRAGDESASWLKACDGLNNIVRPLGAEVTLRKQPLSDTQLQSLLQGEAPAGLAGGGEMVLAVVASGRMVRRADRDPQGRGSEYQFDGGMASLLLDGGNLVFSDRFKGTTGWNPISAEMVMDVLGINVVKRWRDKFSKFLRHELSP